MIDPDISMRRDFIKNTLAAGVAVAVLPTNNISSAQAQPVAAGLIQGRKVRVAVIGCGNVSGSYFPTLVASPHVELVACCDIIPERAEKAATTPISSPSGPSQWLFQGPPAESKFLAATPLPEAPKHLFRPLFPRNPHFPALRSDPMALSGASRTKQIPSSRSDSPNAIVR
ncbi:MAG: twin-arginine translocation signal domain-containing protein [Akkermansiaceae bacterium]|nr:twin-arginine translocation signal domain-containing protein [Akkermansiaceae bacterium]